MQKAYSPYRVLILTNLLLFIYLQKYLFLIPIPSVDLHGHISLIDGLKEQILQGKIIFYDFYSLGGFQAFEAYGFFAHLVIAILAILINLFFNVSTGLIVSITLVIILSLLPNSLYYLARNLSKNSEKTNKNNLNWLAACIGVFSFYFINIDFAAAGIGLAGAFHAGLLPQVFAWHFLLIALTNLLKSQKLCIKTILFTSLLILTHPLTASYFLILAGIYFLSQFKKIYILINLLIPIILTSLWWKDFFIFSEYHTHTSSNQNINFYQLLFNNNELLCYTVWGLILSLLILIFLKKESLNKKFLLTLLIVILTTNITKIIELIPFIHPYRMQAYNLMLSYAVLSFVAFSLIAEKFSKLIAIILILFTVIIVGANPPRAYLYSQSNKAEYLYSNENLLIDTIISSKDTNRVALEYFNDHQFFEFVSPHYLSSQLSRNKIETINGLLIQSSTTPIYAALAGKALGVDVYGPSAFFYDRGQDIKYALELYQGLGVDTLILTNPNVIEILKQTYPIEHFGLYAVIKISEPISKTFQKVNKFPISIKSNKKIAFKLLQYYFLSKPELFRKFELIEYNPDLKTPAINLNLEKDFIEDTDFAELKLILNQVSFIDNSKLESSSDKFYRSYYSYHPKIKAKNAKVFRGLMDRIIILAENPKIELEF